jgi:hypothetical protein
MHPKPDPAFRAQVEACFDEVVELSSSERERWFERRAADTGPDVLDRVRRLLDAHDRGAPVLDEGLSRLHLPLPSVPRRPGRWVPTACWVRSGAAA